MARFSSVDALRGEGMELQAVAVTVIGGTLLSGGYGSVIGTILGAITFGMIQVGLVLAGAPGHFFRTLTGLIVVLAVILNTDVARRLARSRPLAGFRRSSAAADAAIAGGIDRERSATPAGPPIFCRRQNCRGVEAMTDIAASPDGKSGRCRPAAAPTE